MSRSLPDHVPNMHRCTVYYLPIMHAPFMPRMPMSRSSCLNTCHMFNRCSASCFMVWGRRRRPKVVFKSKPPAGMRDEGSEVGWLRLAQGQVGMTGVGQEDQILRRGMRMSGWWREKVPSSGPENPQMAWLSGCVWLVFRSSILNPSSGHSGLPVGVYVFPLPACLAG
jgi:hypothetical protein